MGLHLREAAVDKQFRSRDEACVIGREKHHSLGDFIRCAEPAEGDIVRDILQALLARSEEPRSPVSPGVVPAIPF